jgi:hypothetical protein
LPLIPDVAIHYRCGDNFVGHYGFLPFRAFRETIPPPLSPLAPSTIFVLAENKHRKTGSKKHLMAKCDAIFQSLFDYLSRLYPQSAVLVRRGDDLYLDMARLAFAKVTICSVSTFCLWPAIISNGTAYFPRTKLIVGGDVSLDFGRNFSWLATPSVVSGAAFTHATNQQLIAKLTAE